jgi:thymidine phosphorylase
MIKDRVTAGIFTIVILYFTIRVFAVVYGVVKIMTTSKFIPAETIHHNYSELDKLMLDLKAMKTIKLKLIVQDQSNPVLVDDKNNVIVPSHQIAWVVNKEGAIKNISPSTLAEFIGETINVQADSSGKPVTLNDKAIIIL